VKRFGPRWVNRTIVGIVLATFFSDCGHELSTAVLPLYLTAIGHGPEALALIEGVADFLVSLSKLAGGVLGHVVRRKQPLVAVGYLITAAATGALGLVRSVPALVALRSLAWIGRGYRGPLRDALLSDAVEKTHYGRAFGLERTGDMLGAVVGPLTAALFVWLGFEFRSVLLIAFVPGIFATASIALLVRERFRASADARTVAEGSPLPEGTVPEPPAPSGAVRFPKVFYHFLGGVFCFGLGDFSRAFLIWLAAHALGEEGPRAPGMISIAVLLYAAHNAISGLAAYPVGSLADRLPKRSVLIGGYALGVVTNLLLALFSGWLPGLVGAILLSGVYIAVEQTLEKAVVAELIPSAGRSLGFGILACTNAVGDLLSSLSVGWLLSRGQPSVAFGLAASAGFVGVAWLARLSSKIP
jgi:MFS family permease